MNALFKHIGALDFEEFVPYDPLAAAKQEIEVIRYLVNHTPRSYLSDAVDRLGDVAVDLMTEVERLKSL